MPMAVGYARVSTQEQDLALQLDTSRQRAAHASIRRKPAAPSATGRNSAGRPRLYATR